VKFLAIVCFLFGATLINSYRFAPVVAAQWFDSIDPADTDGTEDADNTTSFGSEITPTSSGSCTKLRIYWDTIWATVTIKIAIFDTGGVPLGTGSASIDGEVHDLWQEITLDSPVAVTASTTYIVMAVPSASSQAKPRWDNATEGRVDFTTGTYSGFPVNPSTLSTATNHRYSVGMYVQ
jgi:Domain of unknown function (DUF4082)